MRISDWSSDVCSSDLPLTAASEFGVCFRHFETESHGFGMNAVAAADSRGQLVLKSAALDDVQQLVDIRQQYVRCAGELHGQAGVEHVGAGHALMHESGGFPHMFGHVGQESDDEIGRASCREGVCQYV